MGADGKRLSFGASLEWPLEELQLAGAHNTAVKLGATLVIFIYDKVGNILKSILMILKKKREPNITLFQ